MLRDEIKLKLNEYLKNKDKKSVSTLRLVLAAVKDRDIAARSNGNNSGISDDEVKLLLQTMIKQRKESAEIYSKSNRNDLEKKENDEIEIIEQYMPSQIDDEEVDELINQVINETGSSNIRDMGKVMSVLKEKYSGQMDFARASSIVKEKLNSQ